MTVAPAKSSRSVAEGRSAAGLAPAGWCFTLAVLLHNADHLRRGVDQLPSDVFWLGTAALLLEVAVVAIIAVRHRLAPDVAVAAGFGLAIGYLVVHFTPPRGWVSDSFIGTDPDGVSVLAAALEAIAAAGLGVAGVRTRRGADVPASRTAGWMVGVMAVGNTIVLAISLVGRGGS